MPLDNVDSNGWVKIEIEDDPWWEEWHYVGLWAEGESGLMPGTLRIWRHNEGDPFEAALVLDSGERTRMRPTDRTDTNGAKLEVLKRVMR